MDNRNLLLDAFSNNIEYLMPSQIAEKYRVLSTGKFKGAFKFNRSPYTREIVDTLSPENIRRVIGCEKGSQIGLTMAAIANMMLAAFKQYQADMLFMTDTDVQVKRAMEGFIEDVIRESGLGDLVGKQNTRSRKKSGTGDTSKEKKFGNGHTLYTWSGQLVGKLSSISPKYSFNDECERYKQSDKKAGSPYALIMNRHKTYSGESKAYFISTPELKATSVIHPIFKQGDQRYYNLPCKHCGVMIDLKWHIDLGNKESAGIKYKRNLDGSLDSKSVGYVCPHCGGFFKENHKLAMFNEVEYQITNSEGTEWVNGVDYRLKNGDELVCQWVPTATPKDVDYGSYHVNALYSGAGFHTWAAIAKEWCLANPLNGPKDMDMLKTFFNQELGLPWEDKKRKMSSDTLRANARNYKIGVIPDQTSKADGNGNIVLLTCAVDLNGTMGVGDDIESDDVRLDYEVVAWCESGDEDYVTSYSVMHGSIGHFERKKDRDKREKAGIARTTPKYTYRHGYPNSVWKEFDEILNKKWPTESGSVMSIGLCGIDTGNYTTHANKFVYANDLCVGLKGSREDDYTKPEVDKKYIVQGTQEKLYRVENNNIKDKLADQMEFGWDIQICDAQPNGFMNFPLTDGELYNYSYFKEYEGEIKDVKKDALGKVITGFRWKKKHTESAQHFWDCRVYNIAIQKLAVIKLCEHYKKLYPKAGIKVTWSDYCKIINRKMNLENKS